MKIRIKSSKKQVINEITEEEYDFVKEALEIPTSELPFSNIFGDKYRILGNFEVVNDEHPLSVIIKFLEERGWSLEPHIDKQPLKFTKSYKVIRPSNDRTEVDTTPRTKTITLTMQKIIQNMVKAFEESLPTMYNQYEELADQAREANNQVSGFGGSGGSDEELDNLIAARDKIKMRQVPLGVKLRNIVSMYTGPQESWQPLDKIADKDSYLSRELLKKAKEYYQITTDEAQMYKWQESFSGLYKPAYVIFSRHPVDVFRMSDFTEITSCHSPPSRKKESGGFDQYNICALAEAYANGMISYVVTAEEFANNGMEPTQETLDEYEDDELFYDEERNEGILEPRARIRIRRGAFTDPDTGNVTPLAVPDQKVYGLDVGGFKEYIRDYIANIQKNDIEKIFPNMITGVENGDTLIELDNFERFGGSYEDSGMAVRQNLPLMFASALGINPLKIQSVGYLKYDKTLENELRTETEGMGMSLEEAQQEADEIAREASKRQAWYFEVSVDEYDNVITVDEVRLVVYAILPEEVDVANNFSKINGIFEDYKDYFSLPWANFDQIEPDEIAVYAAGNVDDSNFSSPFVRIKYPDLQAMSRNATGEEFRLDELADQLNQLTESSRDGGMSIALATDPYVEGGFDSLATTILGLTGFVEDSDFYLQQVADTYSVQEYKEWEEENQSYDYIGPFEIQTDVTYTSTLAIDLSVLQERGGYTPKQAAALLVMLGQDEALQKFLVTEINKECQISAGDADSWQGTVIPFTITGPDNYSSVEEIFEEDPNGQVDDSFDLRIELDQSDVSTKAEKVALAALLEQYDQAEMGESILTFSDELKAKMQELVPAQPVAENKRRMKIRMLRG